MNSFPNLYLISKFLKDGQFFKSDKELPLTLHLHKKNNNTINLQTLCYIGIVVLFALGIYEIAKTGDIYDGVAVILTAIVLLVLNMRMPRG